MTDIRRHLPEIFKLVRKQLSSSGENFGVAEKNLIFEEISKLLPSSYGVGSGVLVNAKNDKSLPVDIFIYDKTLNNAPESNKGDEYQVQQILAVISLAHRHDKASLIKTCETIASVKALKIAVDKPSKNLRANPNSLKGLFPLGLIFFNQLTNCEPEATEEFAQTLIETFNHFPAEQRPDYLFAFTHSLLYRNPKIDNPMLAGYEIGLWREPNLIRPRICYVCKSEFMQPHFFYEQLCGRCGDLNYVKRHQTADLRGKVALVTGGRVKIGYAVALKILRAGAQVIVTTRFPHDAARRFAEESDFAKWSARLHIYGLDMRDLASVEAFVRYFAAAYPRLDILINNAAQTVRRPIAFYAHLLPFEQMPITELPAKLQPLVAPNFKANPALLSVSLSSVGDKVFQENSGQNVTLATLPNEPKDAELFPVGQYDEFQQQLDLRPHNTWKMKLEEISLPEIVEVQAINVIAPTLLVGQLKELMVASGESAKYIINVSAVEGQFSQSKRGVHPHTNMAKAALNMLTHTCAMDYAESNIFMNSVDPGWISEQAPLTSPEAQKRAEQELPLDLIDAAARICDQIFTGENTQQYTFGCLFKDFSQSGW